MLSKKVAEIIVGLFVAIVIAVFSVCLPSPIKKLGLFSCLLGAVVGFVLWKLKEHFSSLKHSSSKQRGELFFIFLLGGISEGVRVGESYRVHLAEQQRRLELDKEIQKIPAMFPGLGDQLTEQIKLSFTDFLAYRYSALFAGLEQSIGAWGLLALFSVEILLAAISAWFLFRHLWQEKNAQAAVAANDSL